MVAYLVLVVGVAQAALASAQAWLPLSPPSPRFRVIEFFLFNAGNAGVIGGTLCSSWPVVLVATILFTTALGMFLYTSWHSRGGWLIHVYRALVTLLFIGATVGVLLSAARHLQ